MRLPATVLALLLAGLVAGCGIKGPPRPPDTAAPVAAPVPAVPDAGCCRDHAP